MAGELWWVPSLVVLAIVVAVLLLLVSLARRRSRATVRLENAAADDLARNAAISLVRADDLVQASSDELGFAVAQFGESATRQFATALATSRRQLRDAFALQQRLDDARPDTAAERRRWSEQIIVLADEATGRLNEQTHDFDTRRVAERAAPLLLEQLRRRLEGVAARVKGGAASADRLALTYAAPAIAPITENVGRVAAALAEAHRAADAAATRLVRGNDEPVGDQLREAERALFRATRLLDAIEIGEDRLHIAFAAVGKAMAAAEAELAEARALRDRHEESEISAELNRVIAQADDVLVDLRRPSRLSDPAADVATLREAIAGLDIIRSEARNRQLRLENARAALGGALLTARSQITVTRDFITANRGRVGSGARTRLAEAERQLTIAEAEADPVTALDTARRAMTHATDADALARFDVH